MVKVKICGNRTKRDVQFGKDASALGFIVDVPSSERSIGLKEAEEVFDSVPPFVDSVLVTTSTDIDRICRMATVLGPDYVQLHADIPLSRLESIRNAVEATIGIIALVQVGENRDQALAKAEALSETPVDCILADTATESGSGGTGKVHDWSVSREVRDIVRPLPLILAGGLNPSNVGEALRLVQPYAVDVASGVEEDSKKSQKQIRDFINEVRRFEA